MTTNKYLITEQKITVLEQETKLFSDIEHKLLMISVINASCIVLVVSSTIGYRIGLEFDANLLKRHDEGSFGLIGTTWLGLGLGLGLGIKILSIAKLLYAKAQIMARKDDKLPTHAVSNYNLFSNKPRESDTLVDQTEHDSTQTSYT